MEDALYSKAMETGSVFTGRQDLKPLAKSGLVTYTVRFRGL
jgi:hypothetical protein